MLIKIYPDNTDRKKITQVTETFRKGGLVAYPTDTVYAVGCGIDSHKAIEKLAGFKGCPVEDAAFSLICINLSQASGYLKPLKQDMFRFIRQNIPGPFTFILPYNNQLPSILKSKRKTVGIRFSGNPVLNAILEDMDIPLVTTSLYKSNDDPEYETDPELIYEQYGAEIDIIVDGGYGKSEPSTVVDCSGDEPEIIREGLGLLNL